MGKLIINWKKKERKCKIKKKKDRLLNMPEIIQKFWFKILQNRGKYCLNFVIKNLLRLFQIKNLLKC